MVLSEGEPRFLPAAGHLLFSFFFLNKCIYFIYFWLRCVFVAALGLSCSEQGLLFVVVWASHRGGFSCCGARALVSRASVVVAREL